jgi:hypothetical protein
MKKILIRSFAVTWSLVIYISVNAQKTEEKLRTEDLSTISEKERTKPTDPAIAVEMAGVKIINGQPKPIVPGGEFKPVNTDVSVTGNTTNAVRNNPASYKEPKQAGTPAALHQHIKPPANEQQKPVPEMNSPSGNDPKVVSKPAKPIKPINSQQHQ